MFSGIIRHQGTIEKIFQKDELTILTIKTPLSTTLTQGDSIAVDGACLTVTMHSEKDFTVEAIPETIAKTIIKNYREDDTVNLEPSMRLGDQIHGHLVTGHIDFVATIQKIDHFENSQVMTINIPPAFHKFFAAKGSITLNGISLTVSALTSEGLEVSLIPETLARTNLGTCKVGDELNAEIDLISRYLERLTSP